MAMKFIDETGAGQQVYPVIDKRSLTSLEEDKSVRDKSPLEVILDKLSNIERLLEFLYERELTGNNRKGSDLMKEPVYEIYIGGRGTGIQGTRSDLERRIVAVAPAETVPRVSIEEFVNKIPINPDVQYPVGSVDNLKQKALFPSKQKSHSYDHV